MPNLAALPGLYWRTLRYLKPIQCMNRVTRRILPARRLAIEVLSPKKELPLKWTSIPRPKAWLSENSAGLLNRVETLEFPGAWNCANYDRIWLYHLHYHDGLLCEQTDSDLKRTWVMRWITDNPPEQGAGWEPYPLSLRIVNWSKWYFQHPESVGQEFLVSLATQARALRRKLEYHLLGNHLFANAKALLFAGVVFDGNEAKEWIDKAFRMLSNQIEEQFHPDGGHFELSTTYHSALTEDLLDIIQLCRFLGCDSANWESVAGKAISWLVVMTRPDGQPPLFNDAAYGIAPTTAEISRYAERMGVRFKAQPTYGLEALEYSGYFRFTCGRYSAFVDAGQVGPDYQPGHAHCDMLSFELVVERTPLVVDTGISTYERGSRRAFERSTAAHNTVQPDGLEQSEMWGAFRVGRRARILHRKYDGFSLEASHDGFRHAGITHLRRFEFRAHELSIHDELKYRGRIDALAIARFHFAPEVGVTVYEQSAYAAGVEFSFFGAIEVKLKEYEYAPSFNVLRKASLLEVSFRSSLHSKIQL